MIPESTGPSGQLDKWIYFPQSHSRMDMMNNVLGSAKPSTNQVGYLFLHRWVGMVKGGYLDKNYAASGRIPRTSAFDAFNIFGI